jgi:hypothetical protein
MCRLTNLAALALYLTTLVTTRFNGNIVRVGLNYQFH